MAKMIDTGTFKINLKEIPAMKIFAKAISNKAQEVEVVLKGKELIIFAKDLGGSSQYILREKNTDIRIKNEEFVGVTVQVEDEQKKDLNWEEVGDLDDDILNDINDDLFDMIYDNENEDVTIGTPVNDNFMTDRDEELDEEIVCKFAVPSKFVKVLSLMDMVEIEVGEKEVGVVSNDGINAIFNKSKSYTKLHTIENATEDVIFEEFDLLRVKSIISAIDKIEKSKARQSISIIDGLLYTYSSSTAIQTEITNPKGNYFLGYEAIRILKYGTQVKSNVLIGEKGVGKIVFDIDGLTIIISQSMGETVNLFGYIRDMDKLQPFIKEINKEFISNIMTIKNIYPEKDSISIYTEPQSIILSNGVFNRMIKTNTRLRLYHKLTIDIDPLLLAISLSGSNNPQIGVYQVDKGGIILMVKGDISVIINAQGFEDLSKGV